MAQITFDEFELHILKPIMKKETMTKTIKYNEAQEIIDIACPQWKSKLALNWAVDIVQKKSIVISDDFYKEMRRACTDIQNELFDIIFGKDNQFKVGDYLTLLKGKFYDGKVTKKIVWIENTLISFEGEMSVFNSDKYNRYDYSDSTMRLATEEEIKKTHYYPKDTPCLVRNSNSEYWKFVYADGNYGFYMPNQVLNSYTFKQHRILDINNLPN